jgi:hypothetical protein
MKKNNFIEMIFLGRFFRVFIFFAIFVTAIYWNSIHGNFIWDDRTYFIDNDVLPHLKPWNVKEIFLQPSNYWGEHLPIRDFLYVLEYNLFGLNTMGYHLVSIGLYALVCSMVYLFLRSFYLNVAKNRLLRSARNDKTEGTRNDRKGNVIARSPESIRDDEAISSDTRAFLVTLLFATYPVHVECVAYISAQKDLLYSLFSLVAMYAFYRFLNTSESKRASLLVAGILSYYLALLSKPTAVALAIFIPLLYLLSDSSKKPGFIKTLIVWVILNLPAVLWILKSIQLKEAYFGSTAAVYSLSFFGRMIRALKIFGAHTALGLKPYPLSFGYPFDSSTSFDANLLIGIITMIVIAVLILFFRKDYPIVSGSCLFILLLFPVLQLHGSLTNLSIYDRYLFIPVLGIAIIMERLLRLLPLALNHLRIVYLSVIFSVVLVFTAITISYIPTFRDDIASTKNTYERFPEWPGSSFNYVYSLIEGGRLNEAYAITLKEKTFSSPLWVQGYFKGWILLEKGMIDNAISELQIPSILAASGGYFPYPNIPLARALILAGRESEAIRVLQEVFKSPIYQPLEVYEAKKLFKKIMSKRC